MRNKRLNFIPADETVTTPAADENKASSGIVPDINESGSGSGWSFIDKLLGTTEKAVDIYTYIKTGEKPPDSTAVVTPSGTKITVGRTEKEKDWTGLTKPWGTIIVVSTAAIVGFAIYKMSKKK